MAVRRRTAASFELAVVHCGYRSTACGIAGVTPTLHCRGAGASGLDGSRDLVEPGAELRPAGW